MRMEESDQQKKVEVSSQVLKQVQSSNLEASLKVNDQDKVQEDKKE